MEKNKRKQNNIANVSKEEIKRVNSIEEQKSTPQGEDVIAAYKMQDTPKNQLR